MGVPTAGGCAALAARPARQVERAPPGCCPYEGRRMAGLALLADALRQPRAAREGVPMSTQLVY
eukprot:3175163-Alexandrium_andersonii.AAC.1